MPQPFSSTADRQRIPASLAPPSAFHRGGTGTFRSSLRKIPSVLFAKESKPVPAPSFREAPPLPSKSPEKTKARTKTRKALGELFGWGNSNATAPRPPAATLAPAPVSYAPPPPPKPVAAPLKPSIATVKPPAAPKINPTAPAVLRKPPSSRVLAKKGSNSAFSTLAGHSALKPPQENVQIGRPSMGEDPFVRRDGGAEVVDVFTRHGVPASVKSCSTHGRESYSSSKALSMKTVLSDEGSVKQTPRRTSVPVVPSSSPHRRNGHTSSPPPPRAELVNLPPRPSSIGHMLDIQPTPETQSPARPTRPVLVFDKASPSPKMKREKTKSRVWGFFTGSRKSQNAKNESKSEPLTTPNESADDNEQYVKINLAPVAPIPIQRVDFAPVQTARGVTASARSGRRPPALRISQPSTDVEASNSAASYANRNTVRSPTDATWTHRPMEVTSRGSPSRNPTGSPEGGVWESVVGSPADRPSVEGPRQVVTALMAPRGVPKRKSLTGLFGMSVKKSMERIRASVDIATRTTVDWKSPKLRSLAEEMEDARLSQSDLSAAPDLLGPLANETLPRASPGLRRVASATDRLVNLLAHFDFSPSTTPSTIASPAMHQMSSLQSLQGGMDGSPTPMRRFKSVMLSTKAPASPHKLAPNVSPLKFALHRATAKSVNQTPAQAAETSPAKSSMVRKGMRNIFAPASPTKQSTAPADVEVLKAPPPTKISPPCISPPASPIEVAHHLRADSFASVNGLPGDLLDLLEHDGMIDYSAPASLEVINSLGLPPPPSRNRLMPRRPGAVTVPAIPLPPVPSPEAPRRGHKASPPHLNLEWARANRDSAFSDVSAFGDFDFTSEYQGLDRGSTRASFMAAVRALGGNGSSLMSLRNLVADDLPSMVATSVPTITHTAADDDELASDEEWDEDEEEDEEMETQVQICRAQISPRREPFKGQWAFQQRISLVAAETTAPPLPPPTLALPPPPTGAVDEAPRRRRGHRRDESGLSIATMSSIGDVIETGIAGEYTNYFDANFTQHLAASSANRGDAGIRAPTRRAHHRRNSSIISVESVGGVELAVPNGPPVSLHNSRRSSYISRHRKNGSSDSAWGRADWAAHRRNASTDSTASMASVASITRLGRPGLGDRMFQLDGGVQLTSITGSPSDIPLGHQQLPRLSKLSEGSEGTVRSGGSSAHHARTLSVDSAVDAPANASFDSLLDGPNELSFDSLLDGSQEIPFDSLLDDTPPAKPRPASGESSNSFFGVSNTEQEAEFFLRGYRPVSGISQVSSSETHVDDTFTNFSKYAAAAPTKQEEECLQAEGEDTSIQGLFPSMMHYADQSSASIGRQLLNTSLSRPAKPKSRHRRPAHLVFGDLSDTPGLTSPSASETSSRMSLDTRFSDFGSFSSRHGRPFLAGHQKQKSSGLAIHAATIKEEASMATLRAATPAKSKPTSASREPTIVSWTADAPPTPSNDTVASWLRFQREAESICQIAKAQYRGQDEVYQPDLDDWKMPTTQSEIAAFLAKSSAAYQPLAQLPTGRIAHRRKSSLADSRMMMSPYGLPLPRPPPAHGERKKGSLETKFERSNSAGSSTFPFAYSPSTASANTSATSTIPTPTTASIFAQFTRQHSGSPPSFLSKAYAPGAFGATGGSPFRLSLPPSFEPTWAADKAPRGKAGSTPPREQRPRVNSGARRQALGWGRRRNSDGPGKVVAIGSGVNGAKQPTASQVPKTTTAATFAAAGYATGRGKRDKENLPPVPPVSGAHAIAAVRAKTSARKALAPIQNRGLRV